MNIFEQATRIAIRFQSSKGELTTEQLWNLPLQSKTGFDLDTVAKAVNRDLKAVTEESFVATTFSPSKTLHELRLEVIKHIIATRLAENEAVRAKAERVAEKERLLAILADKQDADLKALPAEEIAKRIRELS